MITISGAGWAGDLWDEQPVRMPAAVDVTTFMAQHPMPLIWPEDEKYRRHIDAIAEDERQEHLRRSWAYAFFHHPDSGVVVQCLRLPIVSEGGPLIAIALADMSVLAADPRIAEEAARAVWRMGDSNVHTTFTALLSRGAIPSNYPSSRLSRAVDLLRSTCPPGRVDLLRSELS